MILIDTSIWADHFRRKIDQLSLLAERDEVIQHPYVTGELAMGNAQDPKALILSLGLLREARVMSHESVLAFAQEVQLGGTGIGYVDAHLLASVSQMPGARLWTRDKRLAAQAERLGLAYSS